MAVLVEGISVLVRKDSIQKKTRGNTVRFPDQIRAIISVSLSDRPAARWKAKRGSIDRRSAECRAKLIQKPDLSGEGLRLLYLYTTLLIYIPSTHFSG